MKGNIITSNNWTNIFNYDEQTIGLNKLNTGLLKLNADQNTENYVSIWMNILIKEYAFILRYLTIDWTWTSTVFDFDE